jgi:hypothetical protein
MLGANSVLKMGRALWGFSFESMIPADLARWKTMLDGGRDKSRPSVLRFWTGWRWPSADGVGVRTGGRWTASIYCPGGGAAEGLQKVLASPEIDKFAVILWVIRKPQRSGPGFCHQGTLASPWGVSNGAKTP